MGTPPVGTRGGRADDKVWLFNGPCGMLNEMVEFILITPRSRLALACYRRPQAMCVYIHPMAKHRDFFTAA